MELLTGFYWVLPVDGETVHALHEALLLQGVGAGDDAGAALAVPVAARRVEHLIRTPQKIKSNRIESNHTEPITASSRTCSAENDAKTKKFVARCTRPIRNERRIQKL